MKRIKYALMGALCMLLASTALTFAWPGGPPAKVQIKGPGIEGEVEVSEQQILDGLGAEQFIDWNESSTVQPFAADGYELVRYYKDDNHYWALDRVRYYPNPQGGRGAILYVGGVEVNTGGGVWNGKWFNATPEGDAGMARLIKYVTSSSSAANAAQPDNAPAPSANTKSTAPSSSPATPAKDATSDIPYLLTLLAIGIVLFSVVGAFGFWLVRRKRAH